MRNLTNEQKEELQRKIQDEQVKRAKKRWSTQAYLTVLVFLGLGAGCVAFWVYRDAKKRSMRAVVWALFAFFFNPIVLFLYLLETQEEPPVSGVEVNN
ncbi:TPA: hypothetical protein EYP66_16390 [Candidatus Poribacteria bacterium]|nr:hypothetical protein [Candidatus Poribacteria bacterium]